MSDPWTIVDCAFLPSTMTKLYQSNEQATDLTRSSSPPTDPAMPSFYPPTRQRSIISKHLTHDDDDESDSIYKEAFIIQIFQHWKIKTLEHQQALNNREKTAASDHFSKAHEQAAPSASTEIPPERHTDNQRPTVGLQKRVTPVPASYIRRKENLKKSLSISTELVNPNLLAPHTKARSTTGSITSTKKSIKPAPIFIAPKRTQPSFPPRPFALPSFDEATQTKRKVPFERNLSAGDEPIAGSMVGWAPPSRFALQAAGAPLTDDDDDDDETSNEQGRHESLLIRNKKHLPTTLKSRAHVYPLPPVQFNIPDAIFITDPHGHSRTVDFKSDSWNDSTNDKSSPVSNRDIYRLHSIGEEEEEEMNEKEKMDGIILSKELNRIQAFTRSRQPHVDASTKHLEPQLNKVPLGRRWSDGVVSDEEEKSSSSPAASSPLVKMASATSITKQPSATPVKLSKTKYLLMKLHLTSAPSKEEDADLPPPAAASSSSRQRTVRRSSDKKRYQTHWEQYFLLTVFSQCICSFLFRFSFLLHKTSLSLFVRTHRNCSPPV